LYLYQEGGEENENNGHSYKKEHSFYFRIRQSIGRNYSPCCFSDRILGLLCYWYLGLACSPCTCCIFFIWFRCSLCWTIHSKRMRSVENGCFRTVEKTVFDCWKGVQCSKI